VISIAPYPISGDGDWSITSPKVMVFVDSNAICTFYIFLSR
jgi:hypothetical protein